MRQYATRADASITTLTVSSRGTDKTLVFPATLFLIVTGIIIVIAVVGVFYWNAMSVFFNQNPSMVKYSDETFWWMMVPYIFYGVGGVLKSIFYGTGKTKYICYISTWCNFGLIIPFWILARLGFITASFENVMALFVVVFVIDLLITLPYLRTVLRETQTESAISSPAIMTT